MSVRWYGRSSTGRDAGVLHRERVRSHHACRIYRASLYGRLPIESERLNKHECSAAMCGAGSNDHPFQIESRKSGDLSFTLFPGDGPVAVGDNVTFERMATPYITPIGATAYRVRRAGFAPVEPQIEPEPAL